MRLSVGLRALALLPALAGCGRDDDGSAASGVTVEVWAHAGQQSERTTLTEQAARFNASQDSIRVDVTFVPEGSYDAQVQASAVAGRLPDLLELDGPYVARYAWQGHLQPLSGLVADSLLDDLLPSIREQGSYRGELFAVGTFDSGLGLYARIGALHRVGARVPQAPEEAWTRQEFERVLEDLAAQDDDGAVLDLKLNYDGEWFTYAFQPALRSGGGGLMHTDVTETMEASGVLDSDGSIRVMSAIQRWISDGRVDPNLDDAAFVDGRVALSWSGHWDFPRYRERLGDDLVLLPLPSFGTQTRTGQGSWTWAVPTRSRHTEAAVAFLSFLLQPDEVLAMVEANGAVPGSLTASEESPDYGPGGALRLFVTQLRGGWSVPRPRTPAYPFASSVFQDVFEAARNGEDVPVALREAATEIDREVRDNHGYPVR